MTVKNFKAIAGRAVGSVSVSAWIAGAATYSEGPYRRPRIHDINTAVSTPPAAAAQAAAFHGSSATNCMPRCFNSVAWCLTSSIFLPAELTALSA